MADLFTLPEFASYLQRDLDTSSATLARTMASGIVRDHCRCEITTATATRRLPISYDRRGWYVSIPERPLTGVTTVVVNGTTVTTHTVDLLNGHVRLPDGVPTDDADEDVEDQALITYTAGYATVPDNVKAVALAVAGRLYDNPQGLRSRQIEDYSETYAGDGADIAGAGLLAEERRLLRRYRSGAVGSVAVRG